MTTYVSGGTVSFTSINADSLNTIELRVISNLLQAQGLGGGNSANDQLSTLRNDQAFELGITPPVVPGN